MITIMLVLSQHHNSLIFKPPLPKKSRLYELDNQAHHGVTIVTLCLGF